MSDNTSGNTIKSLLAKVRKGFNPDDEVLPATSHDNAARAANKAIENALPPPSSASPEDPVRPTMRRSPSVSPAPRTAESGVTGTPQGKRPVEPTPLRRVQPAGPASVPSPEVGNDAPSTPDIGPLSEPPEALNGKRLGDALVERSLITREQLAAALARQAASGQLLGRILLDMEFITRDQLQNEVQRQHGGKQTTGTILERLGMPGHHIRATIKRQKQFREPLTDIMRDWRFLSQENVAKVMAIENNLEFFPWTEIDDIPIENLRENQIAVKEFNGYVPVAFEKRASRSHVSLVISDTRAINEATSEFKDCVCHFLVGSAETTQTIFRKFFARTEETFDDHLSKHQEAVAHREDVTRTSLYQDMFMSLLRHACYTGASDIALHKSHKIGMVRLKLDGVWELFRSLPNDLFDQLYGVMRNNMIDGVNDEVLSAGFTDCALDLNTDRKEENIKLRTSYADIVERYVFRVEIGNSVQGKTVTIRINDTQSTAAELNQLGFDPQTMTRLRANIKTKNGVFLICGPTGSGKTTSLYALMRSVDPLTVSIQTVERPVEYTHGLWQQFPRSRIEKDEGKQWAAALTGLLRNAPDIILYGETRDEETAKELFRAANTGHLVLSTLHTNGAAETIERLEDLGIPKAKMATVLLGVLAQRLVRKLCTHCKIADDRQETTTLLTPFGKSVLKHIPIWTAFRARDGGCVNCGHTGYRGRRMVYELLHCSKEIRGRLEKNAGLSEIRDRGIVTGTMLENGLRLVAEGITSIDELAAHIDLEI